MSHFRATLFTILALGFFLGTARAQLYVVDRGEGTIRKYDATSGTLINASFITDLHEPRGLAVASGALYVTEYGTGRIGKYDAATGAKINDTLVGGLASPQAIAISGNDLYVTSLDGEGTGLVGKYNATSGAAINANLVSRLPSPLGIAVADDHIFVVYGEGLGAVGEYNAHSGGAINTHLVANALEPNGIVKSGESLWIAYSQNSPSGMVTKFNAETGRSEVGMFGCLIRNLNFPSTLALNGNVLFVASPAEGTVATYNATTGEVLKASFVSGLRGGISGIAVAPTPGQTPSAASSIRDQVVLTEKVYHLDDFLLLLWRQAYAIGAMLVLILAMFVFVASKIVQRPRTMAQVNKPPDSPGTKLKMKPILIGFTLLAVLAIGTFAAYQVAMSFYIAKLMEMKSLARKEVEAEQSPGTLPPPRPVPTITVVTLPPVIIDSENFQTENNWLASTIAHRIAEVVHLALHPNEAVAPDIKVRAKVQAVEHQVHLEITGFSSDPVVADLKPDFAWDAAGYAPLATQLIGSNPLPDPTKITDSLPDELTNMLQPTAARLAADDVALSALLQKHPAWSAAHEQAALLLTVLALRDRAGVYTDQRPMLSRATSHLALAQALRGSTPPTWAGQIADAAIRVLSGRETDAIAHLNALATRADCPDSAKVWITALRLHATGDWRVATLDGQSPLLLKIVWFQVLNDNITALGASAHLNKLGDPLDDVSDWGHAALTNRVMGSVETSNQYCEETTAQEIKELQQELIAEGAPPTPSQKIGPALSEPLREKLFVGDPPVLKIIGPDMFKDFARRHLIIELSATLYWMGKLLGAPDDAAKFKAATWDQFAGMRRFENTGWFAQAFFNAEDVNRELHKTNTTWEPWELADGQMPSNQNLANIHPDIDTVRNFYQDGLPFGTVYNVDDRMNTLWIGAAHHKEQIPADINFNLPTYPYAKDLQALAHGSFTIFMLDKNQRDFLQVTRPWWDYKLQAIFEAEKLTDSLDEDDYTMLQQKHAALDPDVWFVLGKHLRAEGKDDDAAVADRKGFEDAYDQVGMSNSVGPLVNYYFDKNRKDEAAMVAKRAAAVYSQQGLMIYGKLLEKENRLPEAEQVAKNAAERYDAQWIVDQLYAAHPDFFKDQNKVLLDKNFPQGMEKVTIGSFKEPPAAGCVYTSDSDLLEQAGLQVGDVVVALDGYRIENEPQYIYVRGLTKNPHMDLIIWRHDRYLELHASQPDRLFHVDMATYQIQAPTRQPPTPAGP